MKAFLLSLALVFALAFAAAAELYQWVDKNGVIHFTDDFTKVPDEYRGQVKTRKTTPPRTAPDAREPSAAPEAAPGAQAGPPTDGSLYGDRTLEEWRSTFVSRREEIRRTESGLEAKRQFMRVVEGGRRFGQSYSQKDVETYERYGAEIPEDEAKLSELRMELEDLDRQATSYGVPREVRE